MSRTKGRLNNPIITPSCQLRAIPGFPDYFAGSDGNIYSQKLGGFRLMSGGISQPSLGNRYFTHRLQTPGGPKTAFRHALIAAAFHGPRPDGMVIDHINNDGLDNRPGNLRYATPKQNSTNPNNRPNAGQLRAMGRLPLSGACAPRQAEREAA